MPMPMHIARALRRPGVRSPCCCNSSVQGACALASGRSYDRARMFACSRVRRFAAVGSCHPFAGHARLASSTELGVSVPHHRYRYLVRIRIHSWKVSACVVLWCWTASAPHSALRTFIKCKMYREGGGRGPCGTPEAMTAGRGGMDG